MSRPVVESERVVVLDGETESISSVPANSTVLISPGPGGTMTCQVRVAEGDDLGDIDPDNASFSVPTRAVTNGPAYEIVFSATDAEGAGSIAYARRYA